MPVLSNWLPPNLEGVLPNDQAASQFQYRYAVEAIFPIDYLLATLAGLIISTAGSIPILGQSIGSGDLELEWYIQIKDGSEVLFRQRVTITVNVTVLANVGFGVLTLGLYTWAFKKQKIQTEIVGGQEVTSYATVNGVPHGEDNLPLTDAFGNPLPGKEEAFLLADANGAWKHTIGGTTVSEAGGMEIGGGNNFTDQGGIVSDWWDSPVYNMDIPVGAELEILFAGAQGGILPQNLLFQFRFDQAGGIGSYLDRHGALRLGLPIRNRVFIARTYYGHAAQSRREHIRFATDPQLWKDASNRMYIMAHVGGAGQRQWMLWYSDDEAVTLRPLVYTAESLENDDPDLEGKQVAPWKGSFRDAKARPRKQGGYVSIAILNSDIYCLLSPDNITAGPAKKVAPHAGKEVMLEVGSSSDGRERFLVFDGYGLQLESYDGGTTWKDREDE